MRRIDCTQYSPEWWQARCGIPTASCFHRIITSKGQISKGHAKYIGELLADRASPTAPFFTAREGHTAAMRNGINCEPDARRWYAMRCDAAVEQVGFLMTDDGRFGCSPDGLVGEDGGLELKCPQPDTQVGYLMAGVVPREYLAQVHGSLIITGRAWWDFVSYCPGLEPLLIRVTPSDFTKQLQDALEHFWDLYNAASWKVMKRAAPGFRWSDVAAHWRSWLDRLLALDPAEAMDTLNLHLPDLAQIESQNDKAAAWQLIRWSVEQRGWVFNAQTKRFEKADTQPVF